MPNPQTLTPENSRAFLDLLKSRFDENPHRHPGVDWEIVRLRLKEQPEKLWCISKMEETAGHPDVIIIEKKLYYIDCSKESPSGRRSLCYDQTALDARKKNKPINNALSVAKAIGLELLTEKEYLFLQNLEDFDLKTSSWLKTPPEIRNLGGAIFGDKRYGKTFIYHNGADSYYAARGFRGKIEI